MRRNIDELGAKTRRSVLKVIGATLGVGAMGQAAGHRWSGSNSTTDGPEADTTDDGIPETLGLSNNSEVYGYHSLGDEGPARTGGRARSPHFGGITEIDVHGDYAYVSMFSARGSSSGRGLAVVNIAQFNRAKTAEELDQAELVVESFFRNQNPATAMMDVKTDDTGDYVFVGTQPITALFGELGQNQELNDRDSSSSGPNTGSLLTIDVSDKRRPEIVDVAEGFSTGIHNCYHHRIDGQDYVFACKDINEGEAGLYVFRFDRQKLGLTLVNRWTPSGDDAQGDTGLGGLNFYCHDVHVQNDPKNGTPTIYLSYWDGGTVILDGSDPMNLEQIGIFPMLQGHYAVPAPDTVTVDGEERRVAFASHEEPSVDFENPREGKPNGGSTGTIYLVDTDDIYDTDGVVECGELANYTWQDEVTFSGFELSPHNSDPSFHDGELWLHVGHYHGGTRFLKVTPGTERGTTISDDPALGDGVFVGTNGRGNTAGVTAPESAGSWQVIDGVPTDRANDATDWELSEPNADADVDPGELPPGDYARPVEDVPEESKMTGLSSAQPNVWGAISHRGITYSADINQGVFAIKHDDIDARGAIPFVDVERDADRTLYTADQAGRVRLTLADADEDVYLRDRIPSGWEVVAGDAHETYALGGQVAVEFDATTRSGETVTYFAESPNDGVGDTGTQIFGRIERSDGVGPTGNARSATRRGAPVAGIDQNDPAAAASGLTAGTAAGLTGFTYAQRERLRERAAEFFESEE